MPVTGKPDAVLDASRRRLLDEIAADARATASRTGRAAFSDAVMRAMAEVPRDRFVPESVRASAWINRPLPIGGGQTISQPFIVALMTELLDVRPGMRVLDVGGGSGYQAAVLAACGAKVYSVELREELARQAKARLRALGYEQVRMRRGDGREGWPEEAPLDGILVAAAARDVPPALIDQLAPGGRMVIPLSAGRGLSDVQDLMLIEKDEDGAVHERAVLPVAFVPLVGG